MINLYTSPIIEFYTTILEPTNKNSTKKVEKDKFAEKFRYYCNKQSNIQYLHPKKYSCYFNLLKIYDTQFKV